MASEEVLEVPMDAALKKDAEEVYRRMGTSLPEAVRIFARQSVAENAMPFKVTAVGAEGDRRLGIGDGIYDIPDDIDRDNDLVAELFGAS